jgi:hypothetical protein
MWIDESRRDDQVRRLNRLPRRTVDRANFGDHPCFDRDVATARRCTGAVNNCSVFDE